MPPPITVCMLAMNEAEKVRCALESARRCGWCDEIIVFDSGSTDETVAIARELADRVEHHPWENFAANRQAVIAAARNDWVFILDADEEISDALAGEIGTLRDEAFERLAVFTMPRRNYLLGRHVRAWGPDRVARLLNRTRVRWPERLVHDRPEPTQGAVGRLRGALLHKRMVHDWNDYFDGPRYAQRTDALAREMYERGKRIGYCGLMLRPLGAFLKFYVLKRGFLDGAFGLLVAQKAAVSVQLKYARLWEMQHRESRPSTAPHRDGSAR